MPVPASSISWWMTLAALGGIGLVAFLITWGLTDVIRLPRAAYLTALMMVTGATTWGYLAWSGTDAWAFLTHNWAWGVLGAVVTGGIGAATVWVAANRSGVPGRQRHGAARTSRELVWEGLLYGAAEGVLLSVLPVLAAWQTFYLLGWTGTTAGAIGSGALAVTASIVVIYIHHLGYVEYRRSREMVFPIVGCGMLSLAYLLTLSPVAPTAGHCLFHVGMGLRGLPMPPYSKDAAPKEEVLALDRAA
jgi:hypothetical protein